MSPKSRHLISAGVLFSALAFTGATYAQSSSTSTSAGDRAASSPATQSQSASSGSAATNTSSNRSGSASGDTSARATGSTTNASGDTARSNQSNTATPAASAASGAGGSQAASGAADRSDMQRSQSAASGTDSARSATGASASSQGHALRASKVIGADVENASGDDIGEIKDMVVDLQSERVRYVVLSHGGVLGIGDKLFAYPMSMVETRSGDADKISMNVDKEKLSNAPGFDKDKWPDFADAKYTSEIDRYYGAENETRAAGDKPANVVRASELIGKNFDDRQGKDAGEIEDLIVDSSSGRVVFAIVDLDDDWNKQADGKLVAIPLKEFAMGGDDRDDLVIQASGDAIDTSRAFAENQWPDLDDPMWRQDQRSAGSSAQTSAAPTPPSSGAASTGTAGGDTSARAPARASTSPRS